ncbi:MAG: hypothetical protein FWG39_01855 [Alphaproteobacteria bacterium]|nr:hypothetical protein [Alphaproteobacteria bacterium]
MAKAKKKDTVEIAKVFFRQILDYRIKTEGIEIKDLDENKVDAKVGDVAADYQLLYESTHKCPDTFWYLSGPGAQDQARGYISCKIIRDHPSDERQLWEEARKLVAEHNNRRYVYAMEFVDLAWECVHNADISNLKKSPDIVQGYDMSWPPIVVETEQVAEKTEYKQTTLADSFPEWFHPDKKK